MGTKVHTVRVKVTLQVEVDEGLTDVEEILSDMTYAFDSNTDGGKITDTEIKEWTTEEEDKRTKQTTSANTLTSHGIWSVEEDTVEEDTVECSLCGRQVPSGTAHLHQDEYIGEECCWDERLRSSE